MHSSTFFDAWGRTNLLNTVIRSFLKFSPSPLVANSLRRVFLDRWLVGCAFQASALAQLTANEDWFAVKPAVGCGILPTLGCLRETKSHCRRKAEPRVDSAGVSSKFLLSGCHWASAALVYSSTSWDTTGIYGPFDWNSRAMHVGWNFMKWHNKHGFNESVVAAMWIITACVSVEAFNWRIAALLWSAEKWLNASMCNSEILSSVCMGVWCQRCYRWVSGKTLWAFFFTGSETCFSIELYTEFWLPNEHL